MSKRTGLYASRVLNNAMSKAEFEKQREQNKHIYAGSGFVEWGRHSIGNDTPVNEGMHCGDFRSNSYYSKLLKIGRITESETHGVSRTINPIVNCDGIIHTMQTEESIPFPPAPDGTKIYDSETGEVEQFDTAFEAFEGLVTNGDFRTGDTTGWDNLPTTIMTVEDGWCNVISDGVENVRISNVFPNVLEEGESVEVTVVGGATGSPNGVSGVFEVGLSYSTSTVGVIKISSPTCDIGDIVTLKGVLTADELRDYDRITIGTNPTSSFRIKSLTCRKITKQPIISRKDLVFMETWHEKISDKDIFLPHGTAQYNYLHDEFGLIEDEEGNEVERGLPFYEDIELQRLTDLGVGQGYSSHGEWDEDAVGYGLKWSELSDEDKIKLLTLPESNIYLDENQELVQCRYRIRVIEGNSEWRNPGLTVSNSSVAIAGAVGCLDTIYPKPRGANVDFDDFTLTDHRKEGVFVAKNHGWATEVPSHKESGIAYACTSYDSEIEPDGENTYLGINYIPIALVQRLNQGGYHPVWNELGCANFLSANGSAWSNRYWYTDDTRKAYSTADCFKLPATDYIDDKYEDGIIAPGTGHIREEEWTGRQDQYKYYDQIYSGLVEDLRINANKQDLNRLLEDSVQKAIRGETRGKEKLPYTMFLEGKCSASAAGLFYVSGDNITTLPESCWQFGRNIQGFDKVENGTPADDAKLKLAIKIIDVGDTDIDTYNGVLVLNEWYICDSRHVTDSTVSVSLLSPNASRVWISSGDMSTVKVQVMAPVSNYTTAEYDNLPWIDIVGHPERIQATFPNGVLGQWIPQNSGYYELNKKASSSSLSLKPFTIDDGETWSLGNDLEIDNVSNTVNTIGDVEAVTLFHYPALSNFTEDCNNSSMLVWQDKVYTYSSSRIDRANRLVPSLTNNIGTVDINHENTLSFQTDNFYYNGTLGSTNVRYSSDFFEREKYIIRASALTEVFNNGASSETNYASKFTSSIMDVDGLLYTQIHYKELVSDLEEDNENNWGDTIAGTNYYPAYSPFLVASYKNISTDTNGNSVIYGTAKELIPIGIAEYNSSTNSTSFVLDTEETEGTEEIPTTLPQGG